MVTNYFVQHALAEPKEVDKERPLSDAGIQQVQKMALKLKQHNIHIRKIYHSGKLRTQQTALIFSEFLPEATLFEFDGMNPNDSPKHIIDQIAEDAVMYVGHLPNIQQVVSNLITNAENSSVIKFQNSAVACIEIQKGDANLKWYITPEMC